MRKWQEDGSEESQGVGEKKWEGKTGTIVKGGKTRNFPKTGGRKKRIKIGKGEQKITKKG